MTAKTLSAARWSGFDPFAPAAQTGLFALYCLGFFLPRLAFTTTLKQDDAVRHFEAQVLSWRYASNDPALYTWMLRGVQELVGVGLHSSMLVNYALMTGAFWALLMSARMVLAEPRWAALAAWSLVLLPPVMLGHFALAHTTQVLCAGALALLAVLRLARHGRPRDHILLGAAIGLGLLSKYNFGLFVAAAALAALATPALRRRLASPWAAAIPIVALLVAGPALLVLAETFGQIGSTLGQLRHETAGPLMDRMSGLKSAAASVIAYSWPLLLVLLAAAPALWYRRRTAYESAEGLASPELARLLDHYLVAALAVVALTVLISGIPQFHERYMQPLLFALPLVAAVHIARVGAGPRAWQRYRAGLIAAIVGVAAVRLLELSPFCPQACRDLIPYDALAERLRAEGFAQGAIVTGSPVAAGNLRVQFPDSAVFVARTPEALQPAGRAPPCLVIWDAVEWNPPVAADRALGAVGLDPAAAAGRIETIETTWAWHFFTWSWPPGFAERTYRWQYVLLEDRACFPADAGPAP
ncbi:MAG: hypothetical protein GVY13_17550 [Alphaproteobacteria bacterium]|jgi:hypothetical protein|nr:hypothetical protein [Alphaproteobacteria bacterium]